MSEGPELFAIVGMAGRFPGAPDIAAFWTSLREGKELITFFTEDELRAGGVPEERLTDVRYVRAKGYLQDVEQFDADFFGMGARYAEILDPQQRLFLEVAAEALENASCDPRRFSGAIGIFGGASFNTYLLFNLYPNKEVMSIVGTSQAFTSNRSDHLASRVAYALDLHGPAVTVQTACSTSLVATHMACSALSLGECDVALAGGVSVTMPRKSGYMFREGGILSPDGHCRAFDTRAQGTVPGEGAGIVVIRRLEDARACGDAIYAIIRGSAINNDGALKVGYAAPSIDGQVAVIGEAQAVAGVHPDTVTYIETHGTGTRLGDPIEVAALRRVFRGATTTTAHCALGSVKANVGHLDAAAGVTGLIKATLALHHRELPPSLHFETANPQIEFAEGPFYVNTKLRAWEQPAYGGARRAGVSSFGIGGTNCHVVLEEAPTPIAGSVSREQQIILLSANSPAALQSTTDRLVSELLAHRDVCLADVACTLATGRAQRRHRRAVACGDVGECIDLLTRLRPGRVFSGDAAEPPHHGVVFLFPGQGTQYTGMGQQLYRHESVFRQALDRCFEVVEAQRGRDLRSIMWSPDQAEALRSTEWAQCALFSLEWSLAQMWRCWGIEPVCMIGHSIGEYVAACIAGVLELEDAVRLVIRRGVLMQSLPPGCMFSVPLSENELVPWLQRFDSRGTRLSVAAVNGPAQCVVSGRSDAMNELEREMVAAGIDCSRLRVSHSFHSVMTEPILEEFAEAVAGVPLRPPRARWISNLTGKWVLPQEATNPLYWVRQLRSTVRFSEGLTLLFSEVTEPLLEVGPGQVLRTLARWHSAKTPGHQVFGSLPAADTTDSEPLHVRSTVGRLWVAGVGIDQERYFAGECRNRIRLPTYPFERKRYWVDAPDAAEISRRSQVGVRRLAFDQWFYIPSWHRAPLPQAAAAGADQWVIFADRYGLADLVALRLRACGAAVAVRYGSAALEERFPSAVAQSAQPAGALHVLHLGSIAIAGERESEPADELERGFFSLLKLCRTLGRSTLPERVELLVASSGVCEVTGNEPLSPERAALLGPCRVLPHEDPRIRCKLVDLLMPVGAAGGTAWERLADQLLAEALAHDAPRVVAYRGSQRWVESYQRLPLTPSAANVQTPVRPGSVYLITGGLGGLGLEIAALFAKTPGARIALLGRTSLTPPEEWDEILGQATQTQRGITLRRIRDLQNVAEVKLLSADVTDLAQLRLAIQSVRSTFGHIDGVVHAAGLPARGIIQLKSNAAAEEILAPKVIGARNLCSLLAEDPPEFLLLCSARGGLLGGIGQVDYCAANAYLDTLAHQLSRTSATRVVAIDWPAWKEVGMLVDRVRGEEAERAESAGRAELPIFDEREGADPGRSQYLTRFTPGKHWVLDEHRIFGTPVIPGTAYLDMACAALTALTGSSALTLHDVLFIKPVIVRDGQQKLVRTTVERAAHGWRFIFSSSRDEGGESWEEICTGFAESAEHSEAPIHDIPAWITGCTRGEVLQSHDSPIRDDNGPRWRSLRKLWLGENELVARFELPEEYGAELGSYQLHPALLDRVNMTGRDYLAGNLTESSFYLPFAYRRLTVHGRLPREIWARVRFKPQGAGERNETLTFDTVIVDPRGRELVSIAEFIQKRVVDATDQIRLLAGESSTGEAPNVVRAESVYERVLRDGISTAEGIAALTRILGVRGLPQIIISPTDLLDELATREPRTLRGPPAALSDLSKATPVSRHARPELARPYRAPRSPLERSMAQTWEVLLGVAPIGIDDNFFELGGDSVQGIQLVMRHRESGLQISQQHIFQNQTVAELAAALEQEREVRQASTIVGLTPTQRRQLEGGVVARRATLVRCLIDPVSVGVLTTALTAIRDHHPSLRARFFSHAGGWKQELGGMREPVPIIVRTLPDLPGGDEAALVLLQSELTRSLDASAGILISAALVSTARGRNELLLAIDELAADSGCIKLVLRDLTLAVEQANAGSVPRLQGGGPMFAQWVDQLARRAQTLDVEKDLQRWRSGDGNAAPHEARSETTPVLTLRTYTRTLGVGATALLHRVAAHQRVSLEELAIAALERTLLPHDGPAPVIELQRSFRDEEGQQLDTLAGPLGYAFPLAHSVHIGDIPGRDFWRYIKSDLRPAIREGWQYALAQNQRAQNTQIKQLQPQSPPALRVAFLSSLDAEVLGGHLTEVRWRALTSVEVHLPTLRVFQLRGALHLDWEHDGSEATAAVVEHWAAAHLCQLQALAESGADAGDAELASADFPLANINDATLAKVTDLLRSLDKAAEN